MVGVDGDDSLLGGTGNDTLDSGQQVSAVGADSLDGGDGTDLAIIYRYASALAFVIDISAPGIPQALADGGTLVRVEQLDFSGGGGADSVVGGALADTLNGGTGDDTLRGAGGSDSLDGGDGHNSIDGGEGNDRIFSRHSDGTSTDSIDGGSGTDGLVFSRLSTDVTALTLDISDSTAPNVIGGGSTVTGIEQLISFASGAGADSITGGALADNIVANGGGDTLTGNGGNDSLDGGAGADLLSGGADKDALYGGSENDTLLGGAGDDYLDPGTGDDSVDGGEGNDTIGWMSATGAIVVALSASGGGTFTIAGLGTETIDGIEGILGSGFDDGLTGNAGANFLSGFGGDDTLGGGDGSDTLNGGSGKDTLDGGTGNDHFVFNTPLSASTNLDHLVQFSSGHDRIELENAVFKTLTHTGALSSAAFKDLGASHAKLDASDRIVYNHKTGELSYDADGSGHVAAIKFARIDTHPMITAHDFFII